VAEDRPTPGDAAWRLIWYPRLLLGALALALLVVLAAGDGSSTAGGRVGGDYPAFYGAGTIVLDGAIDELYSPSVQATAQADLHGDESGYLAFAYPPHVAVAYAPLAAVPYRLSYLVHTILMAGAVLAALQLIRPLVAVVDRWYWPLAAAAISVFPLFRAVGAGQNTALTLLLVALVWRALVDQHEILAGVAAGLLLFRPQYAIPLIGLLFLAGHRRAVAAAGGVAIGTWSVNALVLGPGWVTGWLEEVRPFIETDAEVNAHNSVSWLGFAEAISDTTVVATLGVLAALTTASVMALMWWRPDRFPLDIRVAATAVGVVLISPHAVFYDAGLLVFAVIVGLDRGWLHGRAAVGLWVLALAHLAAPAIGATPLALMVMAGFVMIAVRALERAPDPVRAQA